jgi:hypothetical protein
VGVEGLKVLRIETDGVGVRSEDAISLDDDRV